MIMARTNLDSQKQNLFEKNFETQGRGTTSGGRPRKRSQLHLHPRQQQHPPQPQQMRWPQNRRPPRGDCRGCFHSEDLLDQVRHFFLIRDHPRVALKSINDVTARGKF
jgi:hypothetical protein